MPRQDHDDLHGRPEAKPQRPRSAVGEARHLHQEAVDHCEALYLAAAGEVTDEVEQAEARRDLAGREALRALADYHRWLDIRDHEAAVEQAAVDRLRADTAGRRAWAAEQITALAETIEPERTKLQLGTRVVKLKRTTAVVTDGSYDVQALPEAWRRRVPEQVLEAYDVIDKRAAKADLLLGWREGEPPAAGWYDVEGHGRVWLCAGLAESLGGSWAMRQHPDLAGVILADAGLSIEPAPGMDTLRWKPSPPGVQLVRRVHVKVE